MEGVLYLIDENNNKKFVQIDLDRHGTIVEDILDSLIIEERRGEESVPIEDVIAELESNGNLDKYV